MPHNKKLIALLACGLTLLGAASSTISAAAQSASETISSGGLSFATAPSNFSFPGITLNGSAQTVTTTQTWDIADNTGSYAGWNIQLSANTLTTSLAALRVYGQGGVFTTNTANNGGITANSLSNPAGVTVDSGNNSYIADAGNNRVLYYTSGSTTATTVYGQAGAYTTGTANNGGLSATSLSSPQSIAVDSTNGIYVADTGNNRVLYYASGSTTATRVYGQGGVYTTGTANNGGITATSLSNPVAVAVDSGNNLYIADSGNNRVLYYTSGSTTATAVYGQAGVFTTGTANNGGITATSLSAPSGLALDSSNNLYITDAGNNRALYYTSGSTTATRVYGQGGVFTTGNANKGGRTQSSLSNPQNAIVDSSNNLFIADTGNHRVLEYPSTLASAIVVYGQNGNFAAGTLNNGGLNATALSGPSDVSVDTSGKLYVADSGNNRALSYPLVYTLPQPQIPAYTPTQTCDNGVGTCIAATNSIAYPLTLPVSATKVLNATANTGVGVGTFNAMSFNLTMPGTTHAGAYTSLYTIAITSGP